VNSNEFKRWLAKQGCSFKSHSGGSGHLTVTKDGKSTQLPMHGKKELGKGLIESIKKQLGLKGIK
jgi:mRNA interferase HicA